MYQHILLATALAEDADVVAERAVKLAQHMQAKLSIVHVIESAVMIYAGGEYAIPADVKLQQSIMEHARAALQSLSERYRIESSQQHLIPGVAKTEIVRLANKQAVDLIVIGSHAHGAFDFLLGSTAHGVLNTAPCDVLAVRTK